VESEVDRGTTFKIYFPAYKEEGVNYQKIGVKHEPPLYYDKKNEIQD